MDDTRHRYTNKYIAEHFSDGKAPILSAKGKNKIEIFICNNNMLAQMIHNLIYLCFLPEFTKKIFMEKRKKRNKRNIYGTRCFVLYNISSLNSRKENDVRALLAVYR